MQTQALGGSDLRVSSLSYGCMRIAGTWNPDEITPALRDGAFAALKAAYDAGYTLFDHADIYSQGGCERLHGEFLKENPSLRKQTVIATKCGILFGGNPPGTVGRYNFSADHIVWSCERSLERLGVETIDLYQLHRPDLLMDPEEVARAFTILHDSGKVRWFGVSNFLPSTVELLQNTLDVPLIVNQIEVSLARIAPLYDGTLDQCLLHKMTPLSWSPLGGGRLGFAADSVDLKGAEPGKETLPQALAALAIEHETEPAVIALSWLLRHPSRTIPIVGSVAPWRIRDMTKCLDIPLSREEWYRLLVAAQGHAMP